MSQKKIFWSTITNVEYINRTAGIYKTVKKFMELQEFFEQQRFTVLKKLAVTH